MFHNTNINSNHCDHIIHATGAYLWAPRPHKNKKAFIAECMLIFYTSADLFAGKASSADALGFVYLLQLHSLCTRRIKFCRAVVVVGFLESTRSKVFILSFSLSLAPTCVSWPATKQRVYVVAIANKMNKNEPYVYAMNPRKSCTLEK